MHAHFALLGFGNDQNRTRLANSKIEILEWWEALGSHGQRAARQRHLPHLSSGKGLQWDELEFLHRSTIKESEEYVSLNDL